MTVVTNLTNGDDTYTTLYPDEIVNGLGGNDMLFASFDRSILNGGDGDDNLRVDTSNFPGPFAQYVTLNGDAGNDWLRTDADFTTLNGGAGDDTFYLIGSNYSVADGGPDNDNFYINQYSHHDTVQGGDGNDTFTVFGTDHVLTGGPGQDTFLFGFAPLDNVGLTANNLITDFQVAAPGNRALTPEDVLDVSQPLEWASEISNKGNFFKDNISLDEAVNKGYLIVDSSSNVTGGAAKDTVISIDMDGAAGPIQPVKVVTLVDVTLSTIGVDHNNWLVNPH